MKRHCGFTLIELLIVIGIMLVLVGVAIPALRTLTKGDAVREAAREVNLFIESARSDAINTGFAGVWLERDADLNRVTRIFKVKRPPKYRGDFEDVNCFVTPMTVSDLSPTDPNYRTEDFDTTMYRLYFRASENSLFVKNANNIQAIRVNDRIQLNGSGPWFQITSMSLDPINFPNLGPQFANWNGTQCYEVIVALNTFTYDGSSAFSGGSFNNLLVPWFGETNFQIERAPKISTREYLNLPKGTFIDLQHSGFAVEPNPNPANPNVLPRADGRRLGGNEFANQDPSNGATPADSAIDKTFPVLITFRKDGSVDRVDYQVYPTAAANPQTFTPSSEYPRTNIFLLVATLPENLNPNHNSMSDLDNLWIMISRSNGTVVTADILSSDAAATPWEARALSRRGARDGQNLTAN